MTSLPMPSPGSQAMRYLLMNMPPERRIFRSPAAMVEMSRKPASLAVRAVKSQNIQQGTCQPNGDGPGPGLRQGLRQSLRRGLGSLGGPSRSLGTADRPALRAGRDWVILDPCSGTERPSPCRRSRSRWRCSSPRRPWPPMASPTSPGRWTFVQQRERRPARGRSPRPSGPTTPWATRSPSRRACGSAAGSRGSGGPGEADPHDRAHGDRVQVRPGRRGQHLLLRPRGDERGPRGRQAEGHGRLAGRPDRHRGEAGEGEGADQRRVHAPARRQVAAGGLAARARARWRCRSTVRLVFDKVAP